MKKACVFLCTFLIPIFLYGSPLADSIAQQWKGAGFSVAYDYPWRSFAFRGHFSHRVQLDLSKNTITVYTEDLSYSGFTDLVAYVADLQSLFSASGFRETKVIFEGSDLVNQTTRAIDGLLLTDTSTLPFCFLPESQGFARMVLDLSFDAKRLNRYEDPLPNSASFGFSGATTEEIARISSEQNAFHKMQQYQEAALENKLQNTEKELADQRNALLLIAALNDQLSQRIRALEETVATYEASEAAMDRVEAQKRIESEAFQQQGRRLVEVGDQVRKLEESLAEKETVLSQLKQLLSFREAQTQGLLKEVERQAARIATLQSDNARLTEENLRLAFQKQTRPEAAEEKAIEAPSESVGAEATASVSPRRLTEEHRVFPDNQEYNLKIRYTYDDSGKASALQILDKSGSVLETSTYVYDEEGRLLSVRSVGPSTGERTETYDYREHETVKIEFREGKTLKAIQKIEKNSRGQTARIRAYDAKGVLTSTEEYFHEGEELMRVDGYDATGKRVRQTTYAYDGERRLTQITIKEGSEVKWVQTFDYAITGEPEKLSVYDSKGTLLEYTEYVYRP